MIGMLPLCLCWVLFQQEDPTAANFLMNRYPLLVQPATQMVVLGNSVGDLEVQARYEGYTSPDMKIEALLTGPGLSTPRALAVPASRQAFSLPASDFSQEGSYLLQEIRLTLQGQTLVWGQPSQVTIEVIPEILITRVETRRLNQADLQRLGYVFRPEDYHTVEFQLSMVMAGIEIPVSIPVAIPRTQESSFQPVMMEDPFQPPIQVFPIGLKLEEGENPQGKGGDPQNGAYTVFSLLLIPGEFSYLRNHFSVSCLIANVTPEGIEAHIGNLKAELLLPLPTQFGAPLSIQDHPIKPVQHVGLDGLPNTEDDRDSLHPGEEARVEYLLTGLIEGVYDIQTRVEGRLNLGDQSMVVRSIGRGRVLVRNPEFTLVLEHPDTVAEGDAYDLKATFINKGRVPLEGLSMTLHPQEMIGVSLEGSDARQELPPVLSGEEGSLTWRLRSSITGEVVASYFKVEGGATGELRLRVGVGESGEKLTPISIAYPKSFNTYLPNSLHQALRRYGKKLIDFSNMKADELPSTVTSPGHGFNLRYNKALAGAVHLMEYGVPEGEAALRLFSTWVRSLHGNSGADSVRRQTLADGSGMEAEWGSYLGSHWEDPKELLKHLAWENEGLNHLFAMVIEADELTQLVLKDASGRTQVWNQTWDLPFSSIVPLGEGRYLIWCSEQSGVPQVQLRSPLAKFSILRSEGQGFVLHEAGPWNLEAGATLAYHSESGFIQCSIPGQSAVLIPSEPHPIKPLTLLDVLQLDPGLHPHSDLYGRTVGFLLSKPLDLKSLEPLYEHFLINGAPVSAAISYYGGRLILASARMPLGPYKPISYSLSGLRDLEGQSLDRREGSVKASSYFTGVSVQGRIEDHAGSDESRAKVFLYQLRTDSSEAKALKDPRVKHLGNASEYRIFHEVQPDASGHYSFDYVALPAFKGDMSGHGARKFKIGVLLEDGRYDEREYYPRGVSQEMQADFAFLGMGSVTGRVTNSQGQPIPGAPIYILNQINPMTAAITETDPAGYYTIDKIEVGHILVKTRSGQYLGMNSGYLTLDQSPINIDLIVDKPMARVTGQVALQDLDGNLTPLEDVFVGVLMDDTFESFSNNLSHGIPHTAGVRTDHEGKFVLENLPPGFGNVYVYHPQLSLKSNGITLLAGENDPWNFYFSKAEQEGGSVGGMVVDAESRPLANARVNLLDQIVVSDAQGRFFFSSAPLYRDLRITATYGNGQKGLAQVYLDEVFRHREGVLIQLYQPLVVTGIYLDAEGRPRKNYPVVHHLEAPSKAGEKAGAAPRAEKVLSGDCPTLHTYSNEMGLWSLEIPWSSTQLNAFAGVNAPYLAEKRNVFVDRSVPLFLVLKEQDQAPLRVRLIDAQGQAVVGEVKITDEMGDSSCRNLGLATERTRLLVTNNQGVAEFSNVNVGEISIVANSILLGSIRVDHFDLDPSGDELTLRFSEQEMGTIVGRVLDKDGVSPAPAGTRVFAAISIRSHLSGPPDMGANVPVDENGYYSFASLVETATVHNVHLIFYHEASGLFDEAHVQLHNGIRYRQDSVLKGTGRLSVGVQKGDGSPADFAAVQLSYRQFEVTRGAGGERVLASNRVQTQQVTPDSPRVWFEGVPTGPIRLKAIGSRGLAGIREYAMPADGQDLELLVRLEASSAIRGTFVDDAEVPIELAEVQLRDEKYLLESMLTGDASSGSGRFSFLDVPMRTYNLLGKDPATARTAQARVITSPFEPEIDVTLKLDPVVELLGVLYDEQRIPVAGAVLELHHPNFVVPIMTGTDAEGRYRFSGIRESSYSLVGYKRGINGKAKLELKLEREPDGRRIQDLYFEPTSDVYVTLLNADGQRAGRVLLHLLNGTSNYWQHSLFTDAEGRAVFRNLPRSLRYFLHGEDPQSLAEVWDRWHLSANEPAESTREVRFPGTGTIVGHLRDEAGRPLADSVHVVVDYTTLYGSYGEFQKVTRGNTTDIDGYFRIGGLPVGQEIQLRAFNPGSLEWNKARVTLREHREEAEVDLNFRAATRVEGRVSYQDGSPASGASVITRDPIFREIYTHSDGSFVLSPVPTGEVLLEARDRDSQRRGDLRLNLALDEEGNLEPVTGVEIRLGGVADLRGTAHFYGGSPILSGQVVLRDLTNGEEKTAPIYADGSYRALGLPLGEWELKAYDYQYGRESEAVRVTLAVDGSLVERDVTFEQDYSLTGRTLDVNQTVMTQVGIELWRYDGTDYKRYYYVESNDQGFYQIQRVFPGQYRLIAYNRNKEWAYSELLQLGSDRANHDLRLVQQAWILGRVLDDQNRPFVKGIVSLTQNGIKQTTQVEANGDFGFFGLMPSTYELSASVSEGWIKLTQNGYLVPGLNAITLRSGPTLELSGRYFLRASGAGKPTAQLLNASGIRRNLNADPSGYFSLGQVPAGEELHMTLQGGSAHRTEALGSFSADSQLPDMSLDPSPPTLVWSNENLEPELPWSLRFLVSESDPLSQIPAENIQVWINGEEISDLFRFVGGELSAVIENWPRSIRRGENRLQVRLMNDSHAYAGLSRTFVVNQSGTNLLVNLKENGQQVAGSLWVAGHTPVTVEAGEPGFLSNLPAGPVTLKARSESGGARADVTIQSGLFTQEHTLNLGPYGEIRGRVLDRQLQPVPGVQVAIAHGRETTNEEGRYVLDLLPLSNASTLTVAFDNRLAQIAIPALRVTGQVVLADDLILHGKGGVRGVVTEEDGLTPVSGVSMTLEYTNLSGMPRLETTTDAAGRYEFVDIWAFGYRVRANEASRSRAAVAVGELGADGEVDEVNMSLAPAARVRGQLLTQAGAAAAHQLVRLKTHSPPWSDDCLTDEDGHFSLDGAPRSFLKLTAEDRERNEFLALDYKIQASSSEWDAGVVRMVPNQLPRIAMANLPTTWDPEYSMPHHFSVEDDYGLESLELSFAGVLAWQVQLALNGTTNWSSMGGLQGLPSQVPEGPIQWRLVLRDLLGSVVETSGVIQVRYDADGPIVNVLEPAAGQELAEGAALVIRVNATDLNGVDRLELRYQGQLLESSAANAVFHTFAPNVETRQERVFELHAYDLEGNLSLTEVRILVNPIATANAPQVELQSPLDGLPQPLGLASGLELPLQAKLRDEEGLARYQWLVNGIPVVERELLGPAAELNEFYRIPDSQKGMESLEFTLIVTDLGGLETMTQARIHRVDGQVIDSNLNLPAWDLRYENQTLILAGGTHKIDGPHRFERLFLVNGAKVMQTETSADELFLAGTDLEIGNELVINGDSSFAVDGSGYRTMPQPLAQVSNGSHAGLGRGVTEPGEAYGSPFRPTLPGSSSGGGALRLKAGSIWLMGRVQAQPLEKPSSTPYSLGSGGSIWLESAQFQGYGLVSANGFAQGSGQYEASKGGGGRVAIYGDFQGRVEAFGGLGAGAGTIYRRPSNGVGDQLEIANPPGSAFASWTPIAVLRDRLVGTDLRRTIQSQSGQTLEFVDVLNPAQLPPKAFEGMSIARPGELGQNGTIENQNGSRLTGKLGASFGAFQDGDRVEVGFQVGEILVRNGAILFPMGRVPLEPLILDQGGIHSDEPLDLRGAELRMTGQVKLSGKLQMGDLAVASEYQLDLEGELEFANLQLQEGKHSLKGILRAESLILAAGAQLSTPTVQNSNLHLIANQMRIEGQLKATDSGLGYDMRLEYAHGGASNRSGSQSKTYGSLYQPSMGGNGQNSTNAKLGGGVIRLDFTQLVLEGEIDVSAENGSAGSVWLVGGPGSQLIGAGRIEASAEGSFGAGGGRIAVKVEDLAGFSGTVEALGGQATTAGGAGTVFYQTAAWPLGKLVVDNGGRVTAPGSTTLPGIASRVLTQASPGGASLPSSNLALGLAGLYAVLDGQAPIPLAANSADLLVAAPGSSFPPTLAGAVVTGLHKLDVLEVSGAAQFYSPDPIELTQPIQVSGGASIGATVIRAPSGSGNFSNGTFTISTNQVPQLILDQAHVTTEVALDLQRVEMRNGSTLTYLQPLRVGEVVVNGGRLIAKTAESGLIASSMRLSNGAVWTVGPRRSDKTPWPLRAQISGILEIEQGSSITTTGTDLVGITHQPWSGSTFSTNSHGGFGTTNSGLDQPLMGSFSNPTLFGGNYGGGQIQISAGELRLHGLIQADGINYGAGGSIRIDAPLLNGTGTLSAKGGGPRSGGGRIAIYYDQDPSFLQTLAFQLVQAPTTSLENFASLGGAGTLFLKSRAQNYGELILDQELEQAIVSTLSVEKRPRLSGIAGFDSLILAIDDSDPSPYVIRDSTRIDLPPGLAGQYALFEDQGVSRRVRIIDNSHNSLTLEEPVSPTLLAGTRIDFLVALDRLTLRDGAHFYVPGILEVAELHLQGAQLNAIECRDLHLPGSALVLDGTQLQLGLKEPLWQEKDLVLSDSRLKFAKPIQVRDISLIRSQIGHAIPSDDLKTPLLGLQLVARNIQADAESGFDASNSCDYPSPMGSSRSYGGYIIHSSETYGSPFIADQLGSSHEESGGSLDIRAHSIQGGSFRADSREINGSAGSVRVQADVLSGTIHFSADSERDGGGRVALQYQDGDTATIHTSATTGNNSSATFGPGSVWVRSGSQTYGSLTLDNLGTQTGTGREVPVLPAFPSISLPAGFSATHDPVSNRTRLLIPGLSFSHSSGGRSYLEDYRGYWLALPDGQTFSILETGMEGANAFFLLAGQPSGLAPGLVLSPAIFLDELRLCDGCQLAPSHLLLLDNRDPWILSASAAPLQQGRIVQLQPFTYSVTAADHVSVKEVRVTFQGSTQSAQGPGPHQFSFTAPAAPALSDFPIQIQVTDPRGNQIEDTRQLSVGPLPDTTPPLVAILTPLHGSSINAGTTLNAQLQLSDNQDLALVRATFNGQTQERSWSQNPSITSALENFEWTLPPDLSGSFTLEVQLTDHAGNLANAAATYQIGAQGRLAPDHYWSMDTADNKDGNPRDLIGAFHSHFSYATTGSGAGIRNQYFQFSNNSYRVVVDGHPSLEGNQALTLSAWVKISNFINGGGILTYGNSNQEAWSLFTTSGNGISFRAGDNQISLSGLSTNQWLHLALRFDRGAVNLFLNGNPAASANWSLSNLPAVNNGWLEFGLRHTGSSIGMLGGLDEVALWKHALSPLQIQTLFADWQSTQLPDFRAPLPASQLKALVSGNQLNLTWTASPTPAAELGGYRLYLDGVLHDSLAPTATSYSLQGLTPDRSYQLELTAFDTAQNESEALRQSILLPQSPFPSPQAYWSLDQADQVNSLPRDLRGPHHANVKSATTSTGFLREGLYFSSSSNRCEFPAQEGLWNDHAFTLSFWFKNTTFNNRILLSYGSKVQELFACLLKDQGNRLRFEFGGTTHSLEAGMDLARDGRVKTQLAKDLWTQVTLAWDGDQARLYLNGLLSAQAQLPASLFNDLNQAYLSLGHRPLNTSLTSGAYLDELILWHRALSPLEILQLHQAWFAAQPLDFRSPTDVAQVLIDPQSDSLQLSWNPPSPPAPDFSSYLLVFADREPLLLPTTQTQQTITGLSPLTLYPFTLFTLDQAGNRSAGYSAQAATLPLDPALFPKPLAYYSFDNPDHKQSMLLDLQGRLHANKGSALTGLTGQVGESFNFSSSSHVIEVPYQPSLFSTDQFSLSTWIFPRSFSNQSSLSFGNGTQEFLGLMQVNGSGNQFRFSMANQTQQLEGGSLMGGNLLLVRQLSTSIWHHVVVTYANGQARLYLNGQLVNQATWPSGQLASLANGWLAFGRKHNATSPAQAQFDESLIWNQALSEVEVQLLQQQGRQGKSFRQDPLDLTPPEDVANLNFQATQDGIDLSWSASANSAQDLAQYQILLDGVEVGRIPASLTQFHLTQLQPDSSYTILVKALDLRGNASNGQKLLAATLPTNGLSMPISYWSYDDEDREGKIIRDLLGPNHSTSGSPLFNDSGIAGDSLSLSTSSSWVAFDRPVLGSGVDFSLQTWFRASTTTTNRTLLGYGTATQNLFRLVYVRGTTAAIRLEVNQGAVIHQVETLAELALNGPITWQIETNRWYHLALSFSAGQVQLYLDGQLQAQAGWPIGALASADNASLTFGKRHSTTTDFFSGYLDETAVWDQPLSQAEIRNFRARGLLQQALVGQAPAKNLARFFQSPQSYEDADNIVLIDERLQLRDFTTRKSLWLKNSEIVLAGALSAENLQLLEGSSILRASGQPGNLDALIQANLLEIDPDSRISWDLDPTSEPDTHDAERQPQLHLLSDFLILDGQITAKSQQELAGKPAGKLRIETRMLYGQGLIDVSGQDCQGRISLHANNALEFEGQMRSGNGEECTESLILDPIGAEHAQLLPAYPSSSYQLLPKSQPSHQGFGPVREEGDSAVQDSNPERILPPQSFPSSPKKPAAHSPKSKPDPQPPSNAPDDSTPQPATPAVLPEKPTRRTRKQKQNPTHSKNRPGSGTPQNPPNQPNEDWRQVLLKTHSYANPGQPATRWIRTSPNEQ